MRKELEHLLEIEGKWFTFSVDDSDPKVDIHLKIRPLYLRVVVEIEKYTFVRKAKKKWKIKGRNWSALPNDVIDYVLEDFKGFGLNEEKPMENTLDNKKKIFEIPITCKGRSILDFVLEKAREIGGPIQLWPMK